MFEWAFDVLFLSAIYFGFGKLGETCAAIVFGSTVLGNDDKIGLSVLWPGWGLLQLSGNIMCLILQDGFNGKVLRVNEMCGQFGVWQGCIQMGQATDDELA